MVTSDLAEVGLSLEDARKRVGSGLSS